MTRAYLHRFALVLAARRGLSAGLVIAAAALGSATASCAGETASRVATGQPVTTGKDEFDAFFKQVGELRAEAEKADKDEAVARLLLVRALSLPEETAADATVKAAGERAKKLRDDGVTLHLELTPEAKLSTRGKREVVEGEGAIKAIEESVKSSISFVRRMSELEKRSAELQAKRRELREKTRVELGSRAEEIERELTAAEQVIAKAAELSGASAGSASRFVLELAAAVETGAGPGPQAPPTRVSVVRGGRSGGKPSKPSGGDGSPPPAKKPKPKSDDFEP